MKRRRLLLIAAGVLAATLPLLFGSRRPVVDPGCAPARLGLDFWQMRGVLLGASGQGSPGAFERFPLSTGRLEVLAASQAGNSFLEVLALVELEGLGDNGSYVASFVRGSQQRWELATWQHSENVKRFDHHPSESELADAAAESGVEPARMCSNELKARVEAKIKTRPSTCDPTKQRCADSAENGRKIFLRMGCPSCHTTDGSARVGPSLTHLIGRSVALSDGTTLRRDRAYLKESVLDPMAKVVQGFSPAMTSFEDRLEPRQVEELLYYLESL